ncbi:MAG: WbqC family protein [Proteobacteria bacterium]|nr:WbqC family protein [Pseudomonadota bacterium]
MLTVAIHQPNYLPWLGYFHKIRHCDVFVFLDDVQYSKNSYINRVQILNQRQAKFLTVPVSYEFGASINAVSPAQLDWPKRHLDTLKGFYRKAPCFSDIWPDIETILSSTPQSDLATSNRYLVESIASKLGFACDFRQSSELETGDKTGDDRLIEIVSGLAPGGRYLSGKGGASYQDGVKFRDAGLELHYADFDHPTYPQSSRAFVEGLSVLDAAFSVGWADTAALLERTN